MTSNNSANKEDFITINDYSKLLKSAPMISSNLVEPAMILARILGYKSVDEYACELIKKELIMYLGLDVDKIIIKGENFQEYIKRFVNESE